MTKEQLKNNFNNSGDYSWEVVCILKDNQTRVTCRISKEGLVGDEINYSRDISECDNWFIKEIQKYPYMTLNKLISEFYKSKDYSWQIECYDEKYNRIVKNIIYAGGDFTTSPELGVREWKVVYIQKEDVHLKSKQQAIESLTDKVDLLIEEIKKLNK